MGNRQLAAACFMSGATTLLSTLIAWGHLGAWSIALGIAIGAFTGFLSYKPVHAWKSAGVAARSSTKYLKTGTVDAAREIFARPMMILTSILGIASLICLRIVHPALMQGAIILPVILCSAALWLIVFPIYLGLLASVIHDTIPTPIINDPSWDRDGRIFICWEKMSFKRGIILFSILTALGTVFPFLFVIFVFVSIVVEIFGFAKGLFLGFLAALKFAWKLIRGIPSVCIGLIWFTVAFTIAFLKLTNSTNRTIASTHGPFGGLLAFVTLGIVYGSEVFALPLHVTIISAIAAGLISVIAGLTCKHLVHNHVIPTLEGLQLKLKHL
jgi:hypothetical protein